MKRKYKILRVTPEAHDAFLQKQQKMNVVYRNITGKSKRIPLIRVVNMAALSPIYLGDDELVKKFKKGRFRI